jgi:hypothetical protein
MITVLPTSSSGFYFNQHLTNTNVMRLEEKVTLLMNPLKMKPNLIMFTDSVFYTQ